MNAGIGTLAEQALHAQLKEWLRREGDHLEVPLDGFVIDLVRPASAGQPSLLIEVQTRGFSALRRKLDHLLDRHAIRLVHPISARKWIRKIDDAGREISRRRSPKRGIAAEVFQELTSFPTLLSHPNFHLDVLLIEEEETRRPDPAAWRRRGWSRTERRLLGVKRCVSLSSPEHLMALVPHRLPEPFNTADLAKALGRGRRLATAMAYCLRECGLLETMRRSRSGPSYRLAGAARRLEKGVDKGAHRRTQRTPDAAC